MKGQPSRYVLRDDGGRFVSSTTTLRGAEREARRASRQWGRIVVVEEFDSPNFNDEIVLMVEFELPRTVRVTRHGRYANA